MLQKTSTCTVVLSFCFFLQLPKIEHDIEPDNGFVSTMIWEFTMYMLCFNLDMSDQYGESSNGIFDIWIHHAFVKQFCNRMILTITILGICYCSIAYHACDCIPGISNIKHQDSKSDVKILFFSFVLRYNRWTYWCSSDICFWNHQRSASYQPNVDD